MLETSRRRVLQGIGAGSMAAIAGCNATVPQDDTQTSTQTPTEVEETVRPDVDRVAADPTDIPDPITRTEPAEIDVTLEPREVTAELEDGKTFDYMTFDGQIPGPFIRVRVGDTVNLTFRNPEKNAMPHNVDFHAVAGPGGGGEATMTNPGETTHLRFKVTYPGAFAYHCAVPGDMDTHLSSGMFGIILVEPKERLPEVDHEFYLGQHEIYVKEDDGTLRLDVEAMSREDPPMS